MHAQGMRHLASVARLHVPNKPLEVEGEEGRQRLEEAPALSLTQLAVLAPDLDRRQLRGRSTAGSYAGSYKVDTLLSV